MPNSDGELSLRSAKQSKERKTEEGILDQSEAEEKLECRKTEKLKMTKRDKMYQRKVEECYVHEARIRGVERPQRQEKKMGLTFFLIQSQHSVLQHFAECFCEHPASNFFPDLVPLVGSETVRRNLRHRLR